MKQTREIEQVIAQQSYHVRGADTDLVYFVLFGLTLVVAKLLWEKLDA